MPSLWKDVYSKRVQKYVDANHLVFIDYNMKIEELGIDVKSDFKDAGYVNVKGSVKITRNLGNYFKNNYKLQDYRGGEDNSWDAAEIEKTRRESNSQLNSFTDLDIYLNSINDDNYTIICCTAGEDTWELTKKIKERYSVSSEYLVRYNEENIVFAIERRVLSGMIRLEYLTAHLNTDKVMMKERVYTFVRMKQTMQLFSMG